MTMTIRETVSAYDATHMIFCDRGNGSSVGEHGHAVRIDEDILRYYGDIPMLTVAAPWQTEDGLTVHYASDWIDVFNGYQYRVCA